MSQDPTADLCTALKEGRLEVVSQLLTAGADVNQADEEGWTPLHIAAGGSLTPTLLEVLLKAGANVHARNSLGKTPLHFAASMNSNPAVLEVLLKAGAKVDAKDSMYGDTPLYFAAQFSKASAVLEVLLEAGANPLARDESGATPYDVAKPEHREILRKAMLMRTAFDMSGKSGDSTTVVSETITNTLALGEAMPNRSSDYQWKKIAIGALIICGVLGGFVLGSFRGGGVSGPPSVVAVEKPPTQQPVRDPEQEAVGALFDLFSELGRQGPGALQPATIQGSRQQCLACNGTGRYICPSCRGGGRSPDGSACYCMRHGWQASNRSCPTCYGNGWR